MLPLIAFFSLVFHVTLNSHYINLKSDGLTGLIRYSDGASCKLQGDVLCFVKALGDWDEINKLRFGV